MEQRTLTINRTIDAPLSMVWKAWTDEKELAKWWGPKAFTNPLCEWDARKGGKILIHMKSPDGTIFPMDGNFHDVLQQQKLVFDCGALDADGKRLFDILNTVTFKEENGKTKIQMDFIISNIKAEATHFVDGHKDGVNMGLDKLNDLLNPKQKNMKEQQTVIMERVYRAPIADVWHAITDREAMKQWYFDTTGFRPEVGAEFSFSAGKEGQKCVHLCKVTEIIAGKKISYSWRYEGEEGDSLLTWELFDEGGDTRLKLTHSGLETFAIHKKEDFVAGWTYFLDTALPKFVTEK